MKRGHFFMLFLLGSRPAAVIMGGVRRTGGAAPSEPAGLWAGDFGFLAGPAINLICAAVAILGGGSGGGFVHLTRG